MQNFVSFEINNDDDKKNLHVPLHPPMFCTTCTNGGCVTECRLSWWKDIM